MACIGAGFVFCDGCLGFIWGVCCKSTVRTERNLHCYAHFDCAPQPNICSDFHSYKPAFCNSDSRRECDSFPDFYPNRDSESDAYRFANGYYAPITDALSHAHIHVYCHDHSHQAAFAHPKSKRACHPSRRDAAGTVGNG
jgi:hypothetical protein